MPEGIYASSRGSIPQRIEMWRKLRDQGVTINSTWIDAPSDTDYGAAFWEKCTKEILSSSRLVLYVEADDFPLKGSLIEIGIAIGNNIPVYVVASGIIIDPVTSWPLGSWIKHPLVKIVSSLEDAACR